MRQTTHIGRRLSIYQVSEMAYRLAIYTPVLPHRPKRRWANIPVLIPVTKQLISV